MFEHYMHYQQGDPRRQRRLMIASVVSGVSTLSMLVFVWAANKMEITKVDAPTVDYIMVQMTADEPPPPPPPPPPPAGSDAEPEPEEEDIPEEEVPEEEIVQPKETPDKVPDQKKGSSKGPKVPGVPGGIPGGVPGGVVGGVLGGQLGGQLGGVATKRDTKAPAAMKPISVVKQNAIYTPNPDQAKLASTKAGMFDKRGGVGKVGFCVDANGKTVDVRTKKKFPGDPKVDAILRDTIKKWRFKPFVVGGKKTKTCSVAEFNIKFKK